MEEALRKRREEHYLADEENYCYGCEEQWPCDAFLLTEIYDMLKRLTGAAPLTA